MARKLQDKTIDDPTEEIRRRGREIVRNQDKAAPPDPDAKELAEREEAAKAYATENEGHFVDYLMDCVKQSTTAYQDIRETWSECYRMYKENEPVSWDKKEPWQSRIIIPRPFSTVAYGAAAVKKAFTPKFLSITNSKNQKSGEFWQKVMDNQLNEQAARFVLRFTDAVTMSLAIGVSMEMIPRFGPGRGLEYVLTEPWKIHRDPDAMSRDNQSGLYWIHKEWVDFFVLKEAERKGRYRGVDRCAETSGEGDANDPMNTKERIAARKQQVFQRSQYRKLVETHEFWGTVLDRNANLLLPHATFTVAGGRVIGLPKAAQNAKIRWPGISFSPLPDLLRYGGRGLLEGVRSVWEAMNNMKCLQQDYLLWIVNPMREIVSELLVNPEDAKPYPGKDYMVHESTNGQQVVRTVEQRFITNEMLANLQFDDQNYQQGTFVPAVVQGLPGWRKDVTAREQMQNLDQALGVYSLMGENIEGGAIDAVVAGAEMIRRNAGYSDYKNIFTDDELVAFGISADPSTSNGVTGVPPIDGAFHISGIQALMRDAEALQNIRTLIIPLLADPRFAARMKPYKILKSIETRTNLKDEGIIVSEEEEKLIEAAEKAQAAKQAQAAAAAQELQDAHGAADLIGKVSAMGAPQGEAQ
jgi:hypothetical protein